MGSEIGAISFPQRFGSSLNPHYHFHVLVVDGVFSAARSAEASAESGDPAKVDFHHATELGPEHSQKLARLVQHRVLRAFRRRGLLADDTVADMLVWRGTGGLWVDGSVRIEEDDRTGLERLVRYCARGPLALERLHAPEGSASLASPDARLVHRLPAPDPKGRTEVRLTPMQLLERLARLVPPPHASTATAITASSLPTPG